MTLLIAHWIFSAMNQLNIFLKNNKKVRKVNHQSLKANKFVRLFNIRAVFGCPILCVNNIYQWYNIWDWSIDNAYQRTFFGEFVNDIHSSLKTFLVIHHWHFFFFFPPGWMPVNRNREPDFGLELHFLCQRRSSLLCLGPCCTFLGVPAHCCLTPNSSKILVTESSLCSA